MKVGPNQRKKKGQCHLAAAPSSVVGNRKRKGPDWRGKKGQLREHGTQQDFLGQQLALGPAVKFADESTAASELVGLDGGVEVGVDILLAVLLRVTQQGKVDRVDRLLGLFIVGSLGDLRPMKSFRGGRSDVPGRDLPPSPAVRTSPAAERLRRLRPAERRPSKRPTFRLT